MIDDRHPELRCRHIWRAWPDGEPSEYGPSPYVDRCAARADGEDGLCAHCRPGGCPPPDGGARSGHRGGRCCQSGTGSGYLLPVERIAEPCWDRDAEPALF